VLFGLVLSTLYLVYTVINKFTIEKGAKESFAHNDIEYRRYFTTPTPFNNWLWYIVAENDSGYYVGHRSVFDHQPSTFGYFYRRGYLLDSLGRTDDDLEKLLQFSQGYYTLEQWGDTLVFNDLRFGQIIGWHDPKEKFVFHYYLSGTGDNMLVLQRGRWAKWNRTSVRSLLLKIRGD
jgi:inner membrane protein